jgi:hypothetical protein
VLDDANVIRQSHPAPTRSDAVDAYAPNVARAEQRLAMLRELAELGMSLARELTHRVLDPPATPEPQPEPRHDPAESFARLSRAVRLTLALESQVEEQIILLREDVSHRATETQLAGVASNEGRGLRLAPRDYASAHRNRIRDSVYEVINREITDLNPAHEALDTLYERLTEGERYDAFVHRPLKEAVAAICDDLGLHPDWSRWTADGWPAQSDPSDKPRYSWEFFWAPPGDGARRRLAPDHPAPA